MSNDGIPAPNYTQTPNAILDAMPFMSNSCLRVILAITRQTAGWHRTMKELSITDLQKKTGLSRQGVVNGLLEARQNHVINRRAKDKNDPKEGYLYSLKIANEAPSKTEWKRLEKPQKETESAALCNDVDYPKAPPSLCNDVDYQAENLCNDVDYNKRKSLVLNKVVVESEAQTPQETTQRQPVEPQPTTHTAKSSLLPFVLDALGRNCKTRYEMGNLPLNVRMFIESGADCLEAQGYLAADVQKVSKHFPDFIRILTKKTGPINAPTPEQFFRDFDKILQHAAPVQSAPVIGASLNKFAAWESAASATN